MTNQNPHQKPQNPLHGWIAERSLADAYHISTAALYRLLTRAGQPCRTCNQTVEHRGITHKIRRRYWPSYLHPQAKPRKTQPYDTTA